MNYLRLTTIQRRQMRHLIDEGRAHDDALLDVMTKGQTAVWIATRVLGLLTITACFVGIAILLYASKA